ncbi:MAG: histidine kinase [Prevotellaceae bacterium]|jgi:sensor histidine kinase YesM|nr:histidine kinase [Prevotellaceae bacterium]
MKTNYKTALVLSIAISLLVNTIFLVAFFYREIPSEIPKGVMLRHVPQFDLLRTIVNIFSQFIFSFALYMIIFNIFRIRASEKIRLLLIIVVTSVMTYFLSVSISELQLDLFNIENRPKFRRTFAGELSRDYLVALVVATSSQLIYISQKQQKISLENEALRAEYMNSRYEALKNQVDPHFLFNSLNTLNSLIKINADKAQEFVQQLSYVFRYTLQNAEVISLCEELKFTQAYCHLMKIRYGNNLDFEYNIDEKLYDYLIIPLSLQTLVENAVKHNVVSNKQPLKVKITGEGDTVKVSNPIQLKREVETGERIGLVNLAERYKLMWKKEIITVKTNDTFEVTVPLMKS